MTAFKGTILLTRSEVDIGSRCGHGGEKEDVLTNLCLDEGEKALGQKIVRRLGV